MSADKLRVCPMAHGFGLCEPPALHEPGIIYDDDTCAGVAPSMANAPAAEAPMETGVVRNAAMREAARELVWPSFQQVLAPAESVPAEAAPAPAASFDRHSLRGLQVTLQISLYNELLSMIQMNHGVNACQHA